MQNSNYRTWPNIVAIENEIKAVEVKIEQATDERDLINLKNKRAQLVSKRYDQLQFNKAMAEDESKTR